MRIFFSVTFAVLVLALALCSIFAYKSKKPIGKAVALVCVCLIPPVIGNLFLIASPNEALSVTGFYIYFIGMDIVVFSLLRFTFAYCNLKNYRIFKNIIYILLIADAIQIFVNIWTGHCFSYELIDAYDGEFYRVIPYLGQTLHRILDYTIIGGVIVTFFVKAVTAPKFYSERYWIFVIVMVLITGWESFYIFSRTPVDRSMIGFGVFGLLVFFFSLHYRPLRLLDRMLSFIASKMPEALIFFDNNSRCIWINNQAEEMLGVNNSQVDLVPDLLGKKFGKYEKTGKDWINSYVSESGGNVESFKIERHEVIDDRQRIVGSFLSIRDTSIEENKLRKETYNATHDALTKVYNRAAYNDAIEKIDLKTSFLVIFDFDSFKEVNDTYGHEVGDKVLIKTIDVVKKHFRDEDKIYRFGGDEFAIILTNVNDKTASVIETKVNKINQELELQKDNLPTTSISAGGAYGKDAENTYELFDYADHALYKRKFSGKRGFTLFELDKKY